MIERQTLSNGTSNVPNVTTRASNLSETLQGHEISHKTLPIKISDPSNSCTFNETTSPANASVRVSSSIKISVAPKMN